MPTFRWREDTDARGRARWLEGPVMRRAAVLTLVSVLLVGACGGGEDGASETSGESTTTSGERRDPDEPGHRRDGGRGADRHRRSPGGVHPRGFAVLRRRDHPGLPRKPRSRGVAGGPDDHLLGRQSAHGLRRPEVPPGLTQTGSWTIVSGTGAFEGLHGSGEMEIAYDPDPAAPARETYTGTVTR